MSNPPSSSWLSDSFTPSIMALMGGIGVGLLSMLWRGPKTSYAHAQAVMKAADQVEKAIQEEQAWLNLSFSLGETAHVDGGARHRLALSRHRASVKACNERREALQEAVRARETWTDSVRVLREVVTALRTVDELRGACRMERTLLGGFVPFARVEAALVALDGAPSLSDEEVSAREAFLKALQEAEAWLADPVNVDPEVAPPERSAGETDDLAEDAQGDVAEDAEGDVAEDAEGDVAEDAEGDVAEDAEGDVAEDAEGDVAEDDEGDVAEDAEAEQGGEGAD